MSNLSLELPAAPPLFYRYRTQNYLCGAVQVGHWERVYHMHEASYCQDSVLKGHSTVPYIIRFDLRQGLEMQAKNMESECEKE